MKPQASDGKQKLTKAQVEKQVDPVLLEQKMASCSEEKKEETGDTFDSQKNRSCPKMQMLKFQD